jgi:hypothetical protein
LHPEGALAIKHSWKEYSQLLCDVKQGYKGDLCGVCAKGFGMTSPFSCSRCQGVKVTESFNVSTGELNLQTSINKAGLAGLYIFYWVALTAWCWFSVWSALPDEDQQVPSDNLASGDTEAPKSGNVPALHRAAAAGEHKSASDTAAVGDRNVKAVDVMTSDSFRSMEACWKCGAGQDCAAPDEQAQPLDVVKVSFAGMQHTGCKHSPKVLPTQQPE